MVKKKILNKKQDPQLSIAQAASSRSWKKLLFLENEHSTVWAAFSAFVAVVAIILAIYIPWYFQSKAEASSIAKITYAVTISPNPGPGEKSESTNYWVNNILIWNTGPATAKTLVLHLHIPSPAVFLHAAPVLISSPPAATVKINERSPAGIYEVVLQNFTPGEFAGFRIAYRAEGELAKTIRNDWDQHEFFSSKFAKNFIKQFWFTGEGLVVENIGSFDVEQTFQAK